MQVEVAYGEVADRVTILLLKQRHVADPAKLRHVQTELDALRLAWGGEGLPELETLPQWPRLCAVNAALWDVEDALRLHERHGDFGPAFVDKARSVYKLNDERALLKRQINEELGSTIVEVKSYVDPGM